MYGGTSGIRQRDRSTRVRTRNPRMFIKARNLLISRFTAHVASNTLINTQLEPTGDNADITRIKDANM